MGAIWQHAKRFSVAGAGGTAVFTLPQNTPLERVTIWALSGTRVLTNMDFQVQVNGQDYNPPITLAAIVATDVVYRSGGAAWENDLLPFVAPTMREQGIDPFVISVLITNNGGAAEDVSLIAVGVQHQG